MIQHKTASVYEDCLNEVLNDTHIAWLVETIVNILEFDHLKQTQSKLYAKSS